MVMFKNAIISNDKQYRYTLTRIWDDKEKLIMFIMLNPSTADSNNNDNTIRRVCNFAKSWGYGGIHVVNLYAFRSTDKTMLKKIQDPIGKDNIFYITSLIKDVDKIIYAWGDNRKEPEWLLNLVKNPYCIELSTKGIPKHPLYLKKDLKPILFRENVSNQLT